jgi:hypothetical protein
MVVIMVEGDVTASISHKILSSILPSLLGIFSVDFDIINQLLIRFSTFIKYW